MCEPEYQELKAAEIPRAEAGGVAVDVIAGRSMGVVSPVRTKTPTAYLHVNLAAGATLTQAISPGFNAFLYVLNGDGAVGQTVAAAAGDAEAAAVGTDGGVSAAAAAAAVPKPSPGSGTPVTRYETVVLSNKPGEDGVAVTAGPHGLRFVLISGEPIDEPVVQHGPFVVTSREEVMQAMDDYRGNKNGFEGAFAWEADWDRRHER
jgi:redox-sensitive bicupin YhaK (pirin superfamily)